jgi:hypothetical protein
MSRISIQCYHSLDLTNHPSPPFWSVLIKSTQRSRLTLCEATAPDKALPTCFGGLVAIALFGVKAVDAFLLPLAIPYIQQWDKALDSTFTDFDERMEIEMCQSALMNGIGRFLSKADMGIQAGRIEYEPLEEAFGERLIPLRNEPNEYAMCFI